MLRSYQGRSPTIPRDAYVDPTSVLIGAVTLGAQASVWCGAVLRADINTITVGDRSNIQDLSLLHVTKEYPVTIGDDVTLGHRVVVHGASIGSGVLVGIGAIVLDGAEVGAESLIAAGSVITPGMRIPPRSLVRGLPARVVRPVTDEELLRLATPARNYLEYAQRYQEEMRQR